MKLPAIHTDSPRAEADDPAAQTRDSHRGRWQFSLFTLFLLIVIACLIAGYMGQTRRLAQAKAQIAKRDDAIRRLRQELGIDSSAESALTIADPSKVHVVSLPAWREHEWRWKIYLPPDKSWRVGVEVLESSKGEPLHFISGSISKVQDSGELVFESRLLRDFDGTACVETKLGSAVSSHGSTYLDAMLKMKGKVSIEQAGRPKQMVVAPESRLEILRRIVSSESNASSGSDAEAWPVKRGLVMWVEEDKPGVGPNQKSAAAGK